MADELPKALRDDVRLLGELLGETLRRQENHALYDTVERVRGLAKSARAGNDRDFDELTGVLERMPVDEALPVARAFSHFLTLANIAEQHHRIRRRRFYERDPQALPQIGSCDETLGRLRRAGIPPDTLHAVVVGLRIELVFTAHPTEVTRRTLMQKHRRIADLLALRDRQRLVNRHPLEDACQRLECRIVPSAGALRQRAYPLDGFVQGMILLPPQRFAQQLAKQPHVVAQRFREIVGHGRSVLRQEAGFWRWAVGVGRDAAQVSRTTGQLPGRRSEAPNSPSAQRPAPAALR